MWRWQQDRAAIPIDISPGRAGLARSETDEFHSCQIRPMPWFHASFSTSHRAVEQNRRVNQRSGKMANMACPAHPAANYA